MPEKLLGTAVLIVGGGPVGLACALLLARFNLPLLLVERHSATSTHPKAPGDAAAFKTWLQSVGQHVAEAAKEGGFLGFGGVRVSDAEKATLAEISSALSQKA